MEVQKVKISSVKNNPKNPRFIKDDKFKKLVKSIQEFPQMLELRPIVVDENNIVLGGNMRLKACIEVGIKEVYIVKAQDLTEEQKDEFIVKDNVGFGEWDWDMLANEWDTEKLQDWGLNLPIDLSIDESQDLSSETDNNYSRKIEAPTYEVTGKKPEITELYNVEKYEKLLNDIEYKYNIPEEIKKFLIVSASRHIVFNYANIAEFYAHADKEIQDLMEDSALVIIDFNKAIELGYVRLSEDIVNEYKNNVNEK